MKAYERLLKYAVIKTPSDETSTSTPSSACQFDLANPLKKEMEALGVSDIQLTDNCFHYGNLPATKGYENAPAIGFIAHMDTVADYCEQPIRPIITENYNGKELALGNSGLTLSPKMFPHLESLKGHTLITTDGNTILGADDKAGIAEIMTLVEHLQKESMVLFPLPLLLMKKLARELLVLMWSYLAQILPIHWTVLQRENWSMKTLMHAVLLLIFMG